ncbi:hypothetical protein G4G28_22580 [Massilia sp. Dwa41.01b]|uniref:hypothetical protein n=1 Tax=unclassified Massilia TaxID=2609279 RepID=UPI0016039F8F|nr:MULTISPECIES: hypothetical protein [unclassified Massilia]QNA90591.1 hypothetical protein G4G28_22580 [Massilia sp. Dwa41.01b]QNA97822.1 hypothetical protein G4G31_01660 [Massilia sp. Se16.2.3]
MRPLLLSLLLLSTFATAEEAAFKDTPAGRAMTELLQARTRCTLTQMEGCAQMEQAISKVKNAANMNPSLAHQFVPYEVDAYRVYGLELLNAGKKEEARVKLNKAFEVMMAHFENGKHAHALLDSYDLLVERALDHYRFGEYAKGDGLFGEMRTWSDRSLERTKQQKGEHEAYAKLYRTLVMESERAGLEWGKSLSTRAAEARFAGRADEAGKLGAAAAQAFGDAAKWAGLAEEEGYTAFAGAEPVLRLAYYRLLRGDELLELKKYAEADAEYAAVAEGAARWIETAPRERSGWKEDAYGYLFQAGAGKALVQFHTGKKAAAAESIARTVNEARAKAKSEDIDDYTHARLAHAAAQVDKGSWDNAVLAWSRSDKSIKRLPADVYRIKLAKQGKAACDNAKGKTARSGCVDGLAPSPAMEALEALETIAAFDAQGNYKRYEFAALRQLGLVERLLPKIPEGEQKRSIVKAKQAFLDLSTLWEGALTDYGVKTFLVYRTPLLEKYSIDRAYIAQLKAMDEDAPVADVDLGKVLVPVFKYAVEQTERARKLSK